MMKSATRISIITVILVGVTGCQVTAEKIDAWKSTQNGPAKLRAAVLDTGLEATLRLRAAEALAEINLTAYLAKDLGQLAGKDRQSLTDKLAERLIVRMNGISEQNTTKVQLQAKDALFSLRALFAPEARKKVDVALVQWLTGDWMARGGGEHSVNKIIRVLGRSGAGTLAERVTVEPKVVVAITTLIARYGSDAHREKAAKKLLALVKEQEPPQAKTYEAMGKIRSPSTRRALLILAAKHKPKYRMWALRALRYDPHDSSVAGLAAIASGQRQPMELRGAAFEALEKINLPSTAVALGRILNSDPDWKVRYRAVEAMCACCKVMGVEKLLASLSSRFNYDKKDVIDLIEKDVKDLGKAVLPALRKGLQAESWIAKVVSARLIAQFGSAADAPALQKLAGDRTRLKGKGWAGATVGSIAKAALSRLGGK